MVKVMKYQLQYLQGGGDFYEMQNVLWMLQRQTREILNRTIQECCKWEWKKEKDYPDISGRKALKIETGYERLDGYIYHVLKPQYPDIYSGNVNAPIQKAWKKYESIKKEIWKGTASIPSYKKDQPLILCNKALKIAPSETGWDAKISLFSNEYKKTKNRDSSLLFQIKAKDKSQKHILEQLCSETYKIGESQIVYEKKKWMLYLAYEFEAKESICDPDKILGVDLGAVNAIYASVYNDKNRLCIPGDEALETIRRIKAVQKSKQKQARYCGEGRIGHGTATRVAPAYNAGNRIANMQDTLNHRWSKKLVEYAVKNQCGTIQMEDLSGIKEDMGYPKRLQHWTYYDLQQKIESKAAEQGIQFVKVKPDCTSQRCSRCGCINAKNRPTQSKFLCVDCGYKENADYNASQNLAISKIDEIIEKQVNGAKKKKTKKE